MGENRHGAAGETLNLRVPVGTQILDEDKETVLADLSEAGMRVLMARGGNGGFGNAHFKSSVNQAPRHANPGLEGEERTIWLRLKLIADAGLVGMPERRQEHLPARDHGRYAESRGLSVHDSASAFGRRQLERRRALCAGRHSRPDRRRRRRRGLGTRFLGHVERCAALVHLIDITEPSATEAYRTVRAELEAYGEGLVDKPEIIALNKIDAMPRSRRQPQTRSARACDRQGSAPRLRRLRQRRARADRRNSKAGAQCARHRENRRCEGRRRQRRRLDALSSPLATAKRIVVKIGSSLLIDADNKRARRMARARSRMTSTPRAASAGRS